MKVLFINSRYAPQAEAGPAFFVQYLAEQLAREGDQAVVLCTNTEDYESIDEVNGVLVYRVPQSLPVEKTGERMLNVVMAEWPDVVHTNLIRGFHMLSVPTCARQVGARLVHTVHSYRFLCVEGTLFDNGKMCVEICQKCRDDRPVVAPFIEQLDAAVGVSRFSFEKHLSEGLFTDVPMQRVIYSPYARENDEHVERSEGPEGILRIGFLGRVSPEKGLDALMADCAALPPEVRYTLDIAGTCDPEYQEQLKQDHPDVPARFLGFVPQGQLLGNIDLLAAPSVFDEPLGRVVLEAYAYGVPVLATRLGGMPEIVEDGKTGLLVDPLTPGDMKQMILKLAGDPERLNEMGKNALAKSAEFLPERILADYREVYAPNS